MRTPFARIFILAVVLISPAASQTLPPSEYGALAFYGYNMHDADFGGIPCPVDCHRAYGDGKGNGFAAGFLYRHYFAADWSVSARLMYTDLSARTQHFEESEILVFDTVSRRVPAKFDNSIRVTLSTIGIEPMIEYRGLPYITLLAGCSVGFPVVKDFHQQEILLTPLYTYMEGTRYRENETGPIPNIPGTFFSAIVGIGSRIAVSESIAIAPEVTYFHTFNDIMNRSHWKPHAIRAGIAIQKQF